LHGGDTGLRTIEATNHQAVRQKNTLTTQFRKKIVMTETTKIERIYDAFRSALDLGENIGLTPDSEFEDVPGWDSLGHLRVIAELEDVFDIEFEIEEIVDQNTVQKIYDLVQSKLA